MARSPGEPLALSCPAGCVSTWGLGIVAPWSPVWAAATATVGGSSGESARGRSVVTAWGESDIGRLSGAGAARSVNDTLHTLAQAKYGPRKPRTQSRVPV